MPDTVPVHAPPYSRVEEQSTAVPWYVYSLLIASASAQVGGLWDVSWHSSIGRDTFWTPAHLLTYFCAVLGAISCAILILHATFSKDDSARAVSVGVLGFRGPFASFVVMWGAAAMLVSAPFDNWWHNAYGLDVKILSPPHTLLGLGVMCVQLGGMLLILGCRNRAEGVSRRRFVGLFFPLLIIVPAICLDLVRRRIRDRGKWLQASVLGAAFFAVIVAAQWPFGTFLMSPVSRNWFFGTGELTYFWPPESRMVRNVFYAYEPTRTGLALGMGIALACAILSSRLGLGWAKWMCEVRR